MSKLYDFSNTVLPSLGFFGGTWADHLHVEIKRPVRSVVLRVDSPRKEFLNLRGVLVVRDGRPLSIPDDEYEVQQSSNRPQSNLGPQGISRLTGIHSLREAGPWWKVTFDRPEYIDAVYVFNRRDRLGVRSRRLSVNVTEMDGSSSTPYAGTSREHFEQALSVIERYAGSARSRAEVVSEAHARKWRTDTVRQLNNALRGGSPIPSEAEWLKLAALIPTASNGVLEGEDWFLLAYGLCAQLRRDPRSRSGIYSYSGVLGSRGSLERLEAEFDDVRRSLNGEPLQLLKHGVSPLGALRRDLAGIEAMFPILQQDLRDMDMAVVLAYGTLLGARRDGRIMDHDDDFDLLLVLDAETINEFDEKRVRVLSELRNRKWHVSENGENKNSHLSRDGAPGHLDLFCAWRHGDVLETHMERMQWRSVPARFFAEITEIELEGKWYPAPGCIDEFLEERYGAGWKTPDKFHDWRWPLNDDLQDLK